MRIVSALAFVLALAGAAAAQDQQLGARTKGMGGSYTAFEDDPVSVWLNPAGIATQPDQMSIAYQTYTAFPRGEERGPGDTTQFTVEPKTVLADPALLPSYIGFVFQLGNDTAVGICYARPYLLNYAMDQVTNPNQTTFEPETEIQQDLSRFRVALAKDFKFAEAGTAGFFNHLSVGLSFDIGYERWQFSGLGQDTTDSATGIGFGAGLLLGVYDNTEDFKVNLGVAYTSAVNYDFAIAPDILPAFDMPQQLNVGMTFYLLEGSPLRVTMDFQWIEWSATAEDPIYGNFKGFENALNYSIGMEYRIKLAGLDPKLERVSLYPRIGYRRFDAPWSDKDDLPMTGAFRLVLDTKGEAFNIFTYGIGIAWSTEAGKSRSLDIAGDAGGDAPNFAAGLTFEF
jgi:long-subunit fatty acid transport protein